MIRNSDVECFYNHRVVVYE